MKFLSVFLNVCLSVICENDYPNYVEINFEKRTYSDTYTNT